MLEASLEDAKITSDAQYLAAVQSTSAILRDNVSPLPAARLQRMTKSSGDSHCRFRSFRRLLVHHWFGSVRRLHHHIHKRLLGIDIALYHLPSKFIQRKKREGFQQFQSLA